jgi:four helix bundle protein
MNDEKIETFTDLKVWQAGHEVVQEIYKLTKKFPQEEAFGLTSQMRRSAVSITSNIAEGFGRPSYPDKIRFYYNAHGSLTELKNQILVAGDVGYLSEKSVSELVEKTQKVHALLRGIIKKSKEIRDQDS